MWFRIPALVAGLWLLAAPTVLEYSGVWRTNDTIVGALAASVALIAMSEVMRPMRWINVVLGAWLLVAPAVIVIAAAGHRMLAGLMLLSTSLVRGRVHSNFGGGWSSLWRRRW